MKLLIDNNLPPRLATTLANAVADRGHIIEHKRAKFGAGRIDDEVWLRALGCEGDWCILSEDYSITRRPAELAALREAKLIAFFLRPAWSRGMSETKRLGRLIYRFDDILDIAKTSARPNAFWLPLSGRIERFNFK